MTPSLWSILPEAIGQIQSRWAGGETHTPLTASDITSMAGDVAIVSIHGVITRDDSKPDTVSPDAVAEAVQRAVKDDRASKVVLSIDSPGGSCAGVSELADVIYQAKGEKQIVAFGSGQVCSAAYEVASQCDAIYCEPTTLVGSIGTIMVLLDSSRAFNAMGLEVIAETTAPHKTMGVEGMPITAEHREHVREIVESFNSLFAAAVRRGRSFSQAQIDAVCDGRVFIASEALSRNLIDGVATFGDVLQKTSFPRKGVQMTTSATLADLRAACPDADSDFILSAAEKGLGIEATKFAWAQRKEAVAEAERNNPPEKSTLGIAKPASLGGDPDRSLRTEDFGSLVARYRYEHPNATHRDAVVAVARMHPEAHADFLQGANRGNHAADVALKNRFR